MLFISIFIIELFHRVFDLRFYTTLLILALRHLKSQEEEIMITYPINRITINQL